MVSVLIVTRYLIDYNMNPYLVPVFIHLVETVNIPILPVYLVL